MTNLNYIASQMHLVVQKALKDMQLSESECMEMADIYPSWQSKLDKSTTLEIDDIVKFGENSDGETQLYTVLSKHIPQADWTPDISTSLFKKIGFTYGGISIWTQPLGQSDAYQKGDVVSFENILYVSDIDNNVWQPFVYGWSLHE
ncbi:MAG: hypothetical protein R3Y12_02375 [Clostridia bacterium]